MALRGEPFDKLDEVNEQPSYEVYSDLKKIGLKNDSLKEKIMSVSNENNVFNK